MPHRSNRVETVPAPAVAAQRHVRFNDNPIVHQIGHAHGHVVRPVATPGEWRDMFGSLIGGDAAVPLASDKDSKVGLVKKFGGSVFPAAFQLHNFHGRLATSRAAKMCKEVTAMVTKAQSPESKWYDATAFDIGTRPFAAAHVGWGTIQLGKRAYDMVYDGLADLSRYKDRQELQKILKGYDPATGGFLRLGSGKAFESSYNMGRIKQIGSVKNTWRTSDGGNPWRSNKQRVLDYGARIKDTGTMLFSSVLPHAMAMGAPIGVASTLLTTATGFNCFGHGMATINSFAKGSVQATAMNNIEAARQEVKAQVKAYKLEPGTVKAVATKGLLAVAANRMIQERTYTARISFFQSFAYGLSTVSIALGLTAGGWPSVITSAASLVLMMISNTVALAFNLVHSRHNAKRRIANAASFDNVKSRVDAMDEKARLRYFAGLDKADQIGTIERFMLSALRGNSQADAQAAYDFLHACGISNNTIKALMLNPNADAALSTMQQHMYSNRTKFIAKNLKYTAKTAGYLTGVTYAHRAIQAKKAAKAAKENFDELEPLDLPQQLPKRASEEIAGVQFEQEDSEDPAESVDFSGERDERLLELYPMPSPWRLSESRPWEPSGANKVKHSKRIAFVKVPLETAV